MSSDAVASMMTRCGFTSASTKAEKASKSTSSSPSMGSTPAPSSPSSPAVWSAVASVIFALLATAMTLYSVLSSVSSVSCWALSCLRSCAPKAPDAPSTATDVAFSPSVNAAWAARSARVAASLGTATAIWRSDDPWAIMPMLTPAPANADMNVDDAPGRFAMPSPTMATMDMSSRSDTDPTVDRASSSSKAPSTARIASWPWFAGTAIVTDDSELACVIMSTDTLALDMAARTFSPTSEAPPARDAPSSVNSDASSMDVMPLMSAASSSSSTLPQDAASVSERPSMTVPSKDGLKMLRT
mmetsp:Transcript_32034/g.108787  ORF Transcript_32034/g.108787 Transcript_32034/m.108787 type:complete len:300 (+) Transcript_32034:895-1794(+)